MLNSLHEDLNSTFMLFDRIKASGTILILKSKRNHPQVFGDGLWGLHTGDSGVTPSSATHLLTEVPASL